MWPKTIAVGLLCLALGGTGGWFLRDRQTDVANPPVPKGEAAGGLPPMAGKRFVFYFYNRSDPGIAVDVKGEPKDGWVY